MTRLLTLAVLCLLWPLSALGDEAVYRAPPEGLVVVLAGSYGDTPVELEVRVAQVAGDEVTVETNGEGLQEGLRDIYFRWLVSKESNGNHYAFDEAAVAALWPLEAGKSIELPVRASGANGSYDFQLAATVEALEPLSVPAGTFDTARIRHSLTLLNQPIDLRLETVTWLDLDKGIALKTETHIITEEGEQVMAFAAREIRLP